MEFGHISKGDRQPEYLKRQAIMKTDLSLYRPNVGITLFNRTGLVWIGQRSGEVVKALGDYRWQMPQGGIDEGETPVEAAIRELKEEIGTAKADILGQTSGWLIYDFPPGARETISKRWQGQRQVWVAMRFTGSDADINIETDHPEFDEWKWIELEKTLDLVVPFKRGVYEQMIVEFKKFEKSMDK